MEIIKKTIVLTIVTSIAAVLLAITYSNTSPKIESHKLQELENQRRNVLPGCSSFENVTIHGQECYLGAGETGGKLGAVLPLSVKGYSGDIEMLIGIDMKGRLTGLSIIKQTETPGLGNKIEQPAFTNQFKGLTAAEVGLKKEGSVCRIDAITAATISSRAVIAGVKKGFNAFQEYLLKVSNREILSRIPDGSYRGSGEGFSGPINVEVNVSGHRIKEIKIMKQQEAKQYWKKIKESITGQMLKHNTTEVDSITGATLTSQGLIDAVKNALEAGDYAGKRIGR